MFVLLKQNTNLHLPINKYKYFIRKIRKIRKNKIK